MKFDEYFNLGVISKVFSFKGEIVARLDVEVPNLFDNLPAIFLEEKGNLVPYFVEKLDPQINGFVRIKFRGIDTQEQAKKILKCLLYLPDNLLPKLKEDEFYFHEIVGFTAFDEDDKEVGEIVEVYDLPNNPVAEILINGKEVLVPLNLMIELDKKNQKIYIEIPEGLVDL
ncbi:MAG: ribosome maturation factor RimM [Flavobacteriales bacterium]|jgi:16S rRNA processing protein RimM|nr:ribosome maturation factor RimM [Flavobacteriales bacterium]|tara:strand:+ start:22 stop:534 length:513 start_codon:yes stop_codon:yes gene_type:complete